MSVSKINNLPPESALYQYIVYRIADDGEAFFWGMFNRLENAENAARAVRGFIYDQK